MAGKKNSNISVGVFNAKTRSRRQNILGFPHVAATPPPGKLICVVLDTYSGFGRQNTIAVKVKRNFLHLAVKKKNETHGLFFTAK